MSEASITSALKALRVRTIRENRAGLEHVETLLAMRGCNLAPVPMSRAANRFRKGELRRLILQALRGGPKTLAEVARHIAAERSEVPYATAYERASSVLSRMKAAGLVRREGVTWRL